MSAGSFEPFGTVHGLVVAVVALLTAVIIVDSRKLDAAGRSKRRLRLGLAALAVHAANQTYWIGFRADSGESLPLHMCDVAGFIAIAAFLVPVRPLRALLYYWGLGLSVLAFVIPVLKEGPATPEFWLFWLSHWVIVGGAVYLVLVDRFRPAWRDLAFATVAMVVYGLTTFFLNRVWGTNYMYTGDHPMPTPGDFDLRWPLPRVAAFGFGAFLLMLAVHLPWAVRRRPTGGERR